MLVPGQKLPEFNFRAVVSREKGKEFANITNKTYPGKWLVLYTYPKDFTFICPTEIVDFDKKVKAFAERDAVVIGGSCDNEHSHLAWRNQHTDLQGINHPLAFFKPQWAAEAGILHPTVGVTLRTTIIVDPEGTVRWAVANDLDVGRNTDETLRVLDALQTGELCACNWKKGEDTLTQKMKKAG